MKRRTASVCIALFWIVVFACVPLANGNHFISLKKCHKVCDKICLKFGEENEMPDKDPRQKVGLGGICHCSCCPDGTGMYCFKCFDQKAPEPAFCFNKLKGFIPVSPKE